MIGTLSWLSQYKNSSQAVRQNYSATSGDVVPSEASTSHTALNPSKPTVNNPTGNIETDICSGSCADCNSVFEQLECNFLDAPSASKSVTTCLIDKPSLQHQRLLFNPSCPHPPKLTSFPKRNYGKKQRSFFSAWYDKYQWLHYQKQNDSVLCYYCTTAENRGPLKAFTKKGYSQWKKALERFEKHQNSDSHHEVVDILVTNTTQHKGRWWNAELNPCSRKDSEQENVINHNDYSSLSWQTGTRIASERSFSALRRLKTWLRATEAQQRLNWCMVLHVHKDRKDKLEIADLANEFVSRNASRMHIFGLFV